MALAYPDTAHSQLGQVIARDHFIAALGDRDIELKVRDRDPVDLEAAYKAAIRVETYMKAYEGEKSRDASRLAEKHNDNGNDARYRRDKRDDNRIRQVAQNEGRP